MINGVAPLVTGEIPILLYGRLRGWHYCGLHTIDLLLGPGVGSPAWSDRRRPTGPGARAERTPWLRRRPASGRGTPSTTRSSLPRRPTPSTNGARARARRRRRPAWRRREPA